MKDNWCLRVGKLYLYEFYLNDECIDSEFINSIEFTAYEERALTGTYSYIEKLTTVFKNIGFDNVVIVELGGSDKE